MRNQDNSINYIELPAVDIESTKQFYGAAFGWEFIDYGPGYASFSGAGIDGGFNLESEWKRIGSLVRIGKWFLRLASEAVISRTSVSKVLNFSLGP